MPTCGSSGSSSNQASTGSVAIIVPVDSRCFFVFESARTQRTGKGLRRRRPPRGRRLPPRAQEEDRDRAETPLPPPGVDAVDRRGVRGDAAEGARRRSRENAGIRDGTTARPRSATTTTTTTTTGPWRGPKRCVSPPRGFRVLPHPRPRASTTRGSRRASPPPPGRSSCPFPAIPKSAADLVGTRPAPAAASRPLPKDEALRGPQNRRVLTPPAAGPPRVLTTRPRRRPTGWVGGPQARNQGVGAPRSAATSARSTRAS